ncbi:MAG: hypothetical protein GW914_02960 [Candidatus Aenigmarchaeota archaeon]|nr:hypothetical protein [Candidatus Aenigmarchaeota archaeon]
MGKSQMFMLNLENIIIQRLFEIVKDAIIEDVDSLADKKVSVSVKG